MQSITESSLWKRSAGRLRPTATHCRTRPYRRGYGRVGRGKRRRHCVARASAGILSLDWNRGRKRPTSRGARLPDWVRCRGVAVRSSSQTLWTQARPAAASRATHPAPSPQLAHGRLRPAWWWQSETMPLPNGIVFRTYTWTGSPRKRSPTRQTSRPSPLPPHDAHPPAD